MARTNPNAAVADAPASDPTANGAAPTEGAASETVSKPKATGSVMVQMPTELKDLVEKKAEAEDVTVAAFVRKMIADAFNFVLPAAAPRGRKSKYAGMTPEQAKAAKQKDKETRQQAIKALYAAAKNGEIDIDALIAKYAAEVGGKAKPEGEAENPAEATPEPANA